jgi:uncharacterized protein YjbJ (UPF0337 family)
MEADAHRAHQAKCKPFFSERTMGELIDKVKGKIKHVAGSISGDKSLEGEGEMDEAKGKVKGAVEDIKHAVKQAVKK